MIGLFKRPQTNRKDNEKGMQFGCQQPLLLGERCVTAQKTAARETSKHLICSNVLPKKIMSQVISHFMLLNDLV